MDNLSQVIKNLRVSEKGTLLAETRNSYVFHVDPRATKQEIKQAVTKLFGKKVLAVNTCNYAGKTRRKRTHQAGTAASWKKAIVRLAEGETIETN